MLEKTLLIEPVWNRNLYVLYLVIPFQIGLLIEPVWNRNGNDATGYTGTTHF